MFLECSATSHDVVVALVPFNYLTQHEIYFSFIRGLGSDVLLQTGKVFSKLQFADAPYPLLTIELGRVCWQEKNLEGLIVLCKRL